jgi:hypothetical protein
VIYITLIFKKWYVRITIESDSVLNMESEDDIAYEGEVTRYRR